MTPPTYPMRPMNGGPFDHPANQGRYNLNVPGLWTFEPKFNGWRATVYDLEWQMFNRHNQLLSILNEFRGPLSELRGRGGVCPWWDTEALERRHGIGQGSLILLDWIPVSETGARDYDYSYRRGMVTTWAQPFDWRETPFGMEANALYAVPSFDYATAVQFWNEAPLINELLGCTFYEGLVAKRIDKPYNMQLRSPDEESPHWVKHRFTTL